MAISRKVKTPHRSPGKSTDTEDRTIAITTPVPRVARVARVNKLEQIREEAERQFARLGFEGVSLDSIAAALGISRQNMLYYFSTKDELYVTVLNNVLTSWMQNMEDLAKEDKPAEAISRYVRIKLRFSQERPFGSAVFAREVLAGAPRFGEKLLEMVLPRLRADIATFERWASEGLIKTVDFTHLMFIIWSSTQAYADLAPQFALFMGKPELESPDFESAHTLITEMVVRTLTLTKGRR